MCRTLLGTCLYLMTEPCRDISLQHLGLEGGAVPGIVHGVQDGLPQPRPWCPGPQRCSVQAGVHRLSGVLEGLVSVHSAPFCNRQFSTETSGLTVLSFLFFFFFLEMVLLHCPG